MRRHDQPFELLVGIVGEREDDPVRLRAGLLGADLDAPDDAVRAGRGGDLDAVALAVVALDRPGQVDGAAVDRDPDGLDGLRGSHAETQLGKDGEQQGEQDRGKTHSGRDEQRFGTADTAQRRDLAVAPCERLLW